MSYNCQWQKTALSILVAGVMLAGCSKPAAPAPSTVQTVTRWEYSLVKVEPHDSIFATYLAFYPDTNRWIVGSCADVLNQVRDRGWQEDWISADGLQVLVKRPVSKTF
jgi:ABC-type glycerol-3-phosphate transport system substrate-binding protein